MSGRIAALVERAPAKINLSLAVLRRRADGWHDLASLVAFARHGDVLRLLPGTELGLSVSGPKAQAAGPDADNLVLKASRQFAKQFPGAVLGRFELLKRLPVAAGIGGGSSDAAAALRLLARQNGIALNTPALLAAACSTGADVPVCLDGKPRFMFGTGAELGPVLALPPLFAVLVNPGLAVATPQVFARMSLENGREHLASRLPQVDGKSDRHSLHAALKRAGNDMEDAACALAPVIVDVLNVLGAAPGTRLARMSGSGATCFALFDDCRAAGRTARVIARDHPAWWVKATMIG